MKAVVSVLMVLAMLVLFAQIVLPLGSDTRAKAAEKSGRFFVAAVSSVATAEEVDTAKMAWTKKGPLLTRLGTLK
ncbi:MAG TPA: hypothetical protein VKF36_13825 [Syntrophorhabdales bacterium]|nr:hypothetical protein [Syntrophorhabdales bacterium]